MNELAIVQSLLPKNKAKLTTTGLELEEKVTVKEWEEIGKGLVQCETAFQWWIGDWWAFGENRKWGVRKAIVESKDWAGPSFQTCMDLGSVCRKFETSRRHEVLPFNHHREVAGISDITLRQSLLDWCAAPLKNGSKRPKSIRQLREEIIRRENSTIAEEAIKHLDEKLSDYSGSKSIEEIEEARGDALALLEKILGECNERGEIANNSELSIKTKEIVETWLGKPKEELSNYLALADFAKQIAEQEVEDFDKLAAVQTTELLNEDIEYCKKAADCLEQFMKALKRRVQDGV
jgi:hypothetical protein